MPHAIHITTLKRMLQSPEPVDIKLWTRSGEIQCWHRCISLRYAFHKGARRMKLLDSNISLVVLKYNKNNIAIRCPILFLINLFLYLINWKLW